MIIVCPECQKKLRINAAMYAGKNLSLTCRHCRQTFPCLIHLTTKILVAHGEPEVCQTVLDVCRQDAGEILTCRDADMFRQILGHQSFSVLLLDVALPGAFPFQLVDEIRRSGKPIKIILLPSVYNRTAYKRRPLSLYGADGYLELHHLPDRLIPLLYELVPDLALKSRPYYAMSVEGKERPLPAHADAQQQAEELSRLLVADIALYHQEQIDLGIENLDLAERLAPQLAEGRRMLGCRIPQVELDRQDYLLLALQCFADAREKELHTGDENFSMDDKAQLIQQQFSSSDCEVRIAASRQLAGLSQSNIELFVLGLGDVDWRVRKSSVEIFQQIDHPEYFISDLIKLLYHPENAGLRNAAIEILTGLGALAVDQLRREIAAPDVEVRKFVIDILGEIGDLSCAPGLILFLADPDINVRYAAVETLGKLRFAAAVDPLLTLMSDPDPGLRYTILQALSQIGGKIPTDRLFVYLDDRLLRKGLYDCFAAVGGSEVIPPLVAGLSDPMSQVREAALCALNTLAVREKSTIKNTLLAADAEQIAAGLERIISGAKPNLKEAALALYGIVGSARDLSLLLNCIAEEDLRPQTLRTFAELGEAPFARLVRTFEAQDPLQTLYLIFVGGELGFPSVLPLTMNATRSNDIQLKRTAARALGELGGEAQLDVLLLLLDDEISDIRDTAVTAIVNIAKSEQSIVLHRVYPLLATADAEKRMRIVRILGLIGGETAEEPLLKAFKDSSVNVRCEAIRALNGHFSEIAVSRLTLALTDESAEVRRLAVSALGQCSQEQVFPALALAAGDPDPWVRAAVMRVLPKFSGEVVRDLLLQGNADSDGLVVIAALESAVALLPAESRELQENALNHADPEVVRVAMDQLSRLLGSNWMIPFCTALLNHSHRDIRLHAVRLLGQAGLDEQCDLLEERLALEPEEVVRQAIRSRLSCRLHTARQDH